MKRKTQKRVGTMSRKTEIKKKGQTKNKTLLDLVLGEE
jgi:hypothetical protein